MTIRLALLALALPVAACGRQGDLERPAPLFGEQARAAYEAERAREGAAPDETSREENEREDRRLGLPDSTESDLPIPPPRPAPAPQPAQPTTPEPADEDDLPTG